MKIYTRTGDNGTTGLFGGERVSKADPRLECYGTIDELNAAIGLAAAGANEPILAQLQAVQNELFVIGSHLATPAASPGASRLPVFEMGSITRLEAQIDAADAELAPLKEFILPGGSETAARLHLARTICRRGERLTVELSKAHPLNPLMLVYLNRLSDWLFVMARLTNHRAGHRDISWEKPASPLTTSE
jgi:cob(I)alamin adenosyltransferase